MSAPQTKAERLADANELILQISMHGRKFFYSPLRNRVARFEISLDGKLWFRDDWTGGRVYVAYRGRWRNFSHGGTLRRLVEDLAAYIRTGERISSAHLGPWPEWVNGGDLWGYGSDAMEALRDAAQALDCVRWPACEAAA